MKVGVGKGQFEDYLTTEERATMLAARRAKAEEGRKPKAGKPKAPTKLRGQCPVCGLCGR